MQGLTRACAGMSLVLTSALIVATTTSVDANAPAAGTQVLDQAASRNARTVRVAGSDTLVRTWHEGGQDWAAISLEGKGWDGKPGWHDCLC